MFGRLLRPIFLAGLFLFTSFVLAQAQDGTSAQNVPSSATPSTPSTAPGSPAAKKVWTNENLGDVKGGVSVVGDRRNQNYHMTPSQTADAATVDRIKKTLQKLQSQLDEVNAKLASYKQFQNGEPVSSGERDTSKGYSRTPVDQQMNQLLSKKNDLSNQMGDLLDEARKKGIDPGQLR
jgi:hypothetical protein